MPPKGIWGSNPQLSARVFNPAHPAGFSFGLVYRLPSQFRHFSNSLLTRAGEIGIIDNRTRRYLSWIEDLTTNQGVIGSNPIRRTT